MITYLLIGLAHVIIFGIFVPKTFNNDWVSFKEDCNNTYSKMGWNITVFSGEETYRCFCAGLIIISIAWPLTDIITIYAIIKTAKNNH